MEFGGGGQVEAWLKGDGASAARIAACGIRFPAQAGELTTTEIHVIQPNGSASRGPADWTTELRFGEGFMPIHGVQSYGRAQRGIDVVEAPAVVMESDHGRRVADAFIGMLDRTQKSGRLRTAFHAYPKPFSAQGSATCWMRQRGKEEWAAVSPRRDEFSAVRLAEVADGIAIGVVGRGLFATTIESLVRLGPMSRAGWYQKWTAPATITSVSRVTVGRVYVTAGPHAFEIDLGDRLAAAGRMIQRHAVRGLVLGRSAAGTAPGLFITEPGDDTAKVTYLAAGFPKPETARSNLAPGERQITPADARATGAI